MLVLDFEAIGVDANDAAAATRVVASAAAEVSGTEVFSAADLRRLAALEADKSAAGCSDSSCLAEMAGALGAEAVLFGSLSRLGSTTTASLSLYTAADQHIERASVDVNDLSMLSEALRARTGELLGRNQIAEPVDEKPGNPLFWGVVGGAGVTVAGAALTTVAEILIEDPKRDAADKSTARIVGYVGLSAAVVGVVTTTVCVIAGGLE